MAFLDEDDPFAPPAGEARERRPPPPERERQILVRRLIAVGVGVLILILIVLGVRGCLNARKERAFENYVRDLSALAAESKQLSDTFFGRLENPRNLSELQFETEVKADRGAAEGLVARAQGLDAPGDLSDAQEQLVLAFELRRDGLAAIADNIGIALGDEGRSEALDTITLRMQDFLASDVLYRRARARIDEVLVSEGIDAQAPESQFLPGPDPAEWLTPTTVAQMLAGVTGETQRTGGVHGLGLVETTLDGVALSSTTPTTVPASSKPSVDVSVQNQGESEESDIPVQVTVTGAAQAEGEELISTIAPQATETVSIPIEPPPSAGAQVTIEVFVEPVIGEQVADNNEASYQVSFE